MSAPDATPTFDLLLKILGVLGWVGAAIMFVWMMSRRSQGWDRGNQAWLQLNGDKESKVDAEKIGLVDQHTQTRSIASEALNRTKALQDGIGAHGSRSDIIAQNARKSIALMTTDELEKRAEAEARRKQIVSYQHQAFAEERERDSFPEAPPQLPPRPDPKPFNPDDTGRWKGRKR